MIFGFIVALGLRWSSQLPLVAGQSKGWFYVLRTAGQDAAIPERLHGPFVSLVRVSCPGLAGGVWIIRVSPLRSRQSQAGRATRKEGIAERNRDLGWLSLTLR